MNPLDELKDIHIPGEIGFWPLAYGWWLLALLILAFGTAGLFWLVRRHRYNRPRRLALAELSRINSDQQDWPVRVNSLIKRICLHYLPATQTANLYADDWQVCLLNYLPKSQRTDFASAWTELQRLLYRPGVPSDQHFSKIHQQTTLWLKQATFSSSSVLLTKGDAHV